MKSYWSLFWTFVKVSAFTIGGGMAMVAVVRDILVVKRKWMTDDEFMDILAISQALPGLLAVNTAIFIGYRLMGTRGSIAATLGSVLPPFVIILAIAMLFSGYKDNAVVEAVFKGIRPAVVALIAVPTIQMALKQKWNWFYGILAIATMLLIALLKVSPIYIILVVGVIAVAVAKYREGRQ
ncbi:MAG: chromate transporter [Bacteroidales bacterium]|nr:chromate transporter [Bacteroidales bacterium]